MADPSYHHRRRRSLLLPPWLRPQFRRFKPEAHPPVYIKTKDLPVRRRGFPEAIRHSPALRTDLKVGRYPDLALPGRRSHMQGGLDFPDACSLTSPADRGVYCSGLSPDPVRFPDKEKEIQPREMYPGLFRPGSRGRSDLRDLIRRKTRPPTPLPPAPPQDPPPQPPRLPSRSLYGSGPYIGQFYGPRAPVHAQHLPLWADPSRWASARNEDGAFPGNLQSSLRPVPPRGPMNEPVRSSAYSTYMPYSTTLDRRVWAPGDARSMDHSIYAGCCPLPPRSASRIVAGPWSSPQGQLFERGRTLQGPVPQISRAARLEEELERLGIHCLGQE